MIEIPGTIACPSSVDAAAKTALITVRTGSKTRVRPKYLTPLASAVVLLVSNSAPRIGFTSDFHWYSGVLAFALSITSILCAFITVPMWWHFSDSFLRIAAQKETAEVSKWHKALFRESPVPGRKDWPHSGLCNVFLRTDFRSVLHRWCVFFSTVRCSPPGQTGPTV